MFCNNCGAEVSDKAAVCVKCGVATAGGAALAGQAPKSRVAFVLLGVFLGALGIHNFYAGYTGKAVAQLLITIFLGWLFFPAIGVYIWAIVEVCTVSRDARGVAFM